MMNIREKLVELLRTAKYDILGNTLGQTYSDACLARIAGHLMSNCVTIERGVSVERADLWECEAYEPKKGEADGHS